MPNKLQYVVLAEFVNVGKGSVRVLIPHPVGVDCRGGASII